jgi:hypothetical protein
VEELHNVENGFILWIRLDSVGEKLTIASLLSQDFLPSLFISESEKIHATPGMGCHWYKRSQPLVWVDMNEITSSLR